MSLRVEMLGTARVLADDRDVIQLRATLRDQALTYLAYSSGWVSRDRLGFLFWADTPDQTARHNVRQLLKRIRRLDWLTGLEVEGDNVRWRVSTDVDDLRSGGTGLRGFDLPESGRLLPGFERGASLEFEEWLLHERQRVLGEWQTALLKAAEAAERDGKPDLAARVLEPVLDEIEDETLLFRYMDLAASAGNRNAAINAYRLATDRMRVNLGAEPAGEARALFERLLDQEDHLEDPGRRPVVGRTQETREILGLLARPSCRLLTLLGSGGIGKSTLAEVVARSAAPRFADGWTLVSLESISNPEIILSVIAAGMEIEVDGTIDPFDLLVSVLGDRNQLLVFDNVEHLRAGWVLLSELVKTCPRLSILATSRERLRLEDEWVYEVPPLSPPEAAELVQHHARQVVPDTEVTKSDALAISEGVGGSPLGIELAVPWMRVMSPREIVHEVLGDPSLLSGGSRDIATRHRSLEATMAHSWKLLSDTERLAIEALAVFVAPYTRGLAESVADVNAALLRDLTDKSLISHRTEGLYASHPLVRQYAASRLATDRDRRSEVRTRHARATLGLLDPPHQAVAHRSHIDDMIEGWLHTVNMADHELIGRSADGFGLLLDSTGRIKQGLEVLARAVAQLDDGTLGTRSVVAALRVAEARLLQRRGRHWVSTERAQAAIEAATQGNDQYWLVRALVILAWARKWTEGHAAQHQTLLQALPVARALSDQSLITEVLRGLGCSAPDLEVCREYLTEALERSERLDQPILRCHVLSNLGSVQWGLGRIPEAMRLHEEMLALAKRGDVKMLVTEAMTDLAFLNAEIGDLDTAQALADDAESLIESTEFVHRKITVTQVAGEISRLVGEKDAAQARVYEGLRLATAIGLPPFGLRSLRLHGQLLIDQDEIEEGLRILAVVCSWTQRGPDFTGWILDPRVWEESTGTVDPGVIESVKRWAEDQDLTEVVQGVLAES